jgi:alkylation response protein AidB-like acyl-CoA dehydrogenase
MQFEKGKKMIGGGFLLYSSAPDDFFIREEATEEQRMIVKTLSDFIQGEIEPHTEEIEEMKPGLTVELIRKASELGLLSIDIPEEYDGLGLDKITSFLATETMSRAGGSFGAAFGAQTGIGTLPIIYFGTHDQKKKYLPLIVTGDRISAYALTEPNAGSDALSCKTWAKLSDDGKYYILNGEKTFITNGNFADTFIIFAKIDKEKFTCFVVDKNSPGFTTGPEEDKMGLKGSSTCSLILEDVRVPVENVLGQIGRGHVIAFNILNIGRLKLGIACIGGSKYLIDLALKYAKERVQFNEPISNFGMIREKIANMVIRTYAIESAGFRTVGLVDAAIKAIPADVPDRTKAIIEAIEEYATEASIIKVMGSELLDYVVDEALQIHGGYGYMSEYPIEKPYRDSRINRIFEGTNEINTLLIPGTIMKKAMKGQLNLMDVATLITADIKNPDAIPKSVEPGHLHDERLALFLARRAVLYVTNSIVMKHMQELQKKQELLHGLAELFMRIFAIDCVITKTLKLINVRGEGKTGVQRDIASVYIAEAVDEIETIGKRLLVNVSAQEKVDKFITHFKRYLPYRLVDTIALKERIAVHIIENDGYKL